MSLFSVMGRRLIFLLELPIHCKVRKKLGSVMKFSYLVVFCSLIINSGCKSEKKAVPKPNANSSDLGQGQ